jgi:hypothetical protein
MELVGTTCICKMYEDVEFYKIRIEHRPNPRFAHDYMTATFTVRIQDNPFRYDYYYHHMITQRALSKDALKYFKRNKYKWRVDSTHNARYKILDIKRVPRSSISDESEVIQILNGKIPLDW